MVFWGAISIARGREELLRGTAGRAIPYHVVDADTSSSLSCPSLGPGRPWQYVRHASALLHGS
eukprot:8403308-Lingulodinium_polyedra.AAC.1